MVLNRAKSGIPLNEGVGYGDSYIMAPNGENLVRSRRQVEDFITAGIEEDPAPRQGLGANQVCLEPSVSFTVSSKKPCKKPKDTVHHCSLESYIDWRFNHIQKLALPTSYLAQ